MCLSLNAAPAFGEVEKRVYTACCCNGLGTVKGTLFGKLVADLAAGSPEPMVQDALSEPAPERLYPEPLMTWGARTKLWWAQKRAGRERERMPADPKVWRSCSATFLSQARSISAAGDRTLLSFQVR